MKFNKTTLPNNLRLVTIPMPDNPSVTVLVMVEAGSKYETKDINGISHFLEHMVFKGTTRRPKAIDISRELDGIGAQYNAFTAQEFTGYYAKADAKHLDAILDLVADMYQNPLLDEKEMAKEKGVIVEEIRMFRDLPQKHVMDLLMEIVYGDQPAGWNIAGSEETVKSFSRRALIGYREDHYVASATTVFISGSFDGKSVVEMVKKAFVGVSISPSKRKIPVTEAQDRPRIKVERKDTDQTHIAIALRTFPVKDRRIPAMQILSALLGGGMSSRLFTRMRDELGICYYVRAEHEPFTDHGLLVISAGLDNSRVEEGLKSILAECLRLKDKPVPAAELRKAKDYISGTTLLELETSDARAEFAGYQEVLKGAIESPDELIAKVNAVTAEDIRKLARQVFVNEGLNLALVGRTREESLVPIFKFV